MGHLCLGGELDHFKNTDYTISAVQLTTARILFESINVYCLVYIIAI